ncbi:glycosyltransferase [Microlunatus flavus]|uniref:Glycosyltransferase, GT2 family n=1 Tax=Microlunatus flavus TaxID=1036181 RepID=A0A1H8ZBT5_9ACTN|nr:glycosyltransferase [Microlunatus flavus]SEP61866.1 Glycosyltransferase, GT2 family [Microlunatus flavus]
MRASVVVGVPTYRRPAELADLLPRLLDQARDLPGRPFAVLVVDNDPEGSARATVDALADGRVHYAHQPVPGIAAVRNRILDGALDDLDGDLVAMIDDDERPEPGWLAALVETQEATGAVLVAGRVVPEFTGPLDPWVAAGRFHTRRNLATGAPISVAAAGNLLLDARRLRALGQRFDESVGLAGGEDTLFSRQLHARGEAMVWCAGSVAVDRVLPERMTRRWVLGRAMSHGDAWVRVGLRLAPGPVARTVVRARAALAGSVRVVVGGLRAGAGLALRRPVDQARGLRAALRGLGMVRGALGLHHAEYARGTGAAA